MTDSLDPAVAAAGPGNSRTALPYSVGWAPEEEPGGDESMSFRFYPGGDEERGLPRWWSIVGLTADYLAGCAARLGGKPREFEANFSRLANELLENAFKYRQPGNPEPVEATVYLTAGGAVLKVSHPATRQQAESLLAAVRRVCGTDPSALFMEQVSNPDAAASGLGLLTLIQESGVRPGWRFELLEGNGVRISAWLSFRFDRYQGCQ